MSNLEFFKNQAKKFLKDWRTQTQTVESDDIVLNQYDSKFYDIQGLFLYYELDEKDEQDIKLSRAQHFIAQMVGFKKWDDLIHATDIELELAEFLLRRFKDAEQIMRWEELTGAPTITPDNAAELLEYAKYIYEMDERVKIPFLPSEQISVLSGKPRTAQLNEFDDVHSPNSQLRKDSYVFCPHCQKAFNFNQSKVIKENSTNRTMVVCKNFPSCKGMYIDYKVLSPTILYGPARQYELERGINDFPHLSMNKKIECLHCGDKYLYSEAKVVIDPDDGEAWIHCKNYPNCSGNPLDFMDAE